MTREYKVIENLLTLNPYSKPGQITGCGKYNSNR